MLSKRVKNLEESATLALNAKVKAMQAAGEVVYNLTAGEPDAMTPGYIQKSVAAVLEQNKYTPAAGLPELRQAIASSTAKFYKVRWIKPDNIVVTAGAKPALFAVLQTLLDPGDEVIVPSPYWVSYQHLIELAGGKMINAPLKSNHNLDAEAIIAKLNAKTKIVLLNSPHNPTGAVFSGGQLFKLARALRGRETYILSDDIYVRLNFTKNFKPITHYFKDQSKLVIINGFSKSQALTGWRIGYLLAPAEIAQAATNLLSHATGNAPLPAQHAALSALMLGDKPPMLGDLARRRQMVIKALKRIPPIKFEPPGGAFYFLLDIRALDKNSLRWCERLLEQTGVALVPGEAFGAPGFARLSFAAADKTLGDGLNRLAGFVSGAKL